MTEDCASDYVEIQFWNETVNTWSRVGERACGRSLPPAVSAPFGRTRVVFRSNRAVTGDGWSLSWALGCGGVLTGSEGSLTSPGYPENYANNLACNYTILAPSQHFVVATFVETFDVSIFDKIESLKKVQPKKSEFEFMSSLNSRGQHMLIIS